MDKDRLRHYRKKIDRIDKKIVKTLLLRFKLVKEIGRYKKSKNIKITDKRRESDVIKSIKKNSNKKNQKIIINIFKDIINYSKKIQK